MVIPYVKGISELLERIYRKHNICTAMRPHMTLRKLLVHPKDKREKEEQSGVVYSIPCIDCDKVYIGETGQQKDRKSTMMKRQSPIHQKPTKDVRGRAEEVGSIGPCQSAKSHHRLGGDTHF